MMSLHVEVFTKCLQLEDDVEDDDLDEDDDFEDEDDDKDDDEDELRLDRLGWDRVPTAFLLVRRP